VTENADIWSLPIDTNHPQKAGELIRLTSNAADDLSPSISADGKRIVFESLRTGKRLVWKKDLETGQETELITTPSDEALPKITADGSIVAFLVANYQKQKVLSKPDIYTVPFTGGQPRKVCGECGILGGWSPGSARILYYDEDTQALSLLDPAYGSKHKILDETGHTFWDGRFSPDGRWIAFQAATGPAHAPQVSSYAVPFGNRQRRIPKAEWVETKAGFNWSPSGALLYAAAPTDGSVCLWVTQLNPETKQPVSARQPVYHFHRARLSFIEDPSWRGISVARDKIVFTLKEARGNIWTATRSQQTN
jgi:Tol biopolymer transport system component